MDPGMPAMPTASGEGDKSGLLAKILDALGITEEQLMGMLEEGGGDVEEPVSEDVGASDMPDMMGMMKR
jgi:hypothetical protein